MPKKFYIGDLHFGDALVLWLDNRPFRSVQEMESALVRNWQNAVGPEDTVYVLGDMFRAGMPAAERGAIMEQLPGKKIMIYGNHDEWTEGFEGGHHIRTVQDRYKKAVLCHYPLVAYPEFYDGAVHLYAHVHAGFEAGLAGKIRSCLEGLYKKPCRMYNVGCMMPWMGYTPRTLEEIETAYAKCKLNDAHGYKPETCSMLTLSTGHVSGATAEMLDREGDLNAMGVSVYPKAAGGGEKFGWYVYLPGNCAADSIPDDLRRCLAKTRALGCQVLCLDCDGPEDPELETYDW